MTFSFPWIQNFQNAVGNTVHEFRQAADDMAESFRHQGPEPWAPAPNDPHAPPFPFFFPQPPPPPPHARPFDGPPQRIPPASARAIRQLPTILVTPEDLVDENNRECCICLEPNRLGTKVTRLPCAHIYHSECIVDWLRNHHCTCPVCRYELPTDDPMYEAGRSTRMQARKPRFARYELERMSIKELIDLNRGRAVGIREKKDLIQYLIDNERIDLIPAPEPVEFKMDVLRSMRVSELKRAMADAGVFFHAKDVVEKSDMISIFVNSGRLNIIPAEKEADEDEGKSDNDLLADDSDLGRQSNAALPSKRHLVETVDELSDDEKNNHSTNEERLPNPVEMFPAASNSPESRVDLPEAGRNDGRGESNQAETASEVSTGPMTGGPTSTGQECVPEDLDRNSNNDDAPFDRQSHLLSTAHPTPDTQAHSVVASSEMSIDADNQLPELSPLYHATMSLPDVEMASNTIDNPTSQATSELFSVDVDNASESNAIPACHDESCQVPSCNASLHVSNDGRNTTTDGSASTTTTDGPASTGNDFAEYSVAQLLTLGREARVNLSSCYERSEMINLLVAAGVTPPTNIDLVPSGLTHWNISQLRFLASEMNIDISACNGEGDMIDCILREVNAGRRPHLRHCLAVLAPLANLNSSQLRDVARKWEVYLPDHLDEEESFQHIITQARQFGIC